MSYIANTREKELQAKLRRFEQNIREWKNKILYTKDDKTIRNLLQNIRYAEEQIRQLHSMGIR